MKNLIIILILTLSYSLHSVPKCNHTTHGEKLDKFLNEILMDSSGRPLHDAVRISDKGFFNIYYFTAGENAPEILDKDQNGHPDYVDSAAFYADMVYSIEVEQIGFLSPIPEPGGLSDAYDIYLWDLGNDLASYGQTVPTDQIFPKKTFRRYYSYMLIDNNYSKLDSSIGISGKVQTYYTFGYDALKVTIAHEFHHAIQNMYGIDNLTALTFMESTSTFFEHYVFPSIPDYVQYVKQLFKEPAKMPFGYKGSSNILGPYAYSLFMIYLNEKYDIYLIRKMWENVLDGNNNFYALEIALNSYNSSLNNAWCEFKDWCYYTGDRTIQDNYFEYAESYPEITFYKNEIFEYPSRSSSSFLEPYEMRYYRYIFQNEGSLSDDTLDIAMGSFDIESARFNSGNNIPYELAITTQEIPGSKQLQDLPLYFFIDANYDAFCYEMLLNRGSVNINVANAYPNPYKPNTGEVLFFPAPQSSILYDKVYLSIYSVDMIPLYQDFVNVTANNNKLVVPLERFPENISTGVHIFSVKHNDEFLLGKIAIIRE